MVEMRKKEKKWKIELEWEEQKNVKIGSKSGQEQCDKIEEYKDVSVAAVRAQVAVLTDGQSPLKWKDFICFGSLNKK